MRSSSFQMSGEISIKNKEVGLEYRFSDDGNNVIRVVSEWDGSDSSNSMRINVDDIPAFIEALEKAGEINRKW